MGERTYGPKRGDLVHRSLSGWAGREMAEGHDGLVLSAAEYLGLTGMARVCGIIGRIRVGPWEVLVMAGFLPDGGGVGRVRRSIVADAVGRVDYRERGAAFAAWAAKEVVERVVGLRLAVREDD